MISESFALTQISRLEQLRYFPQTEEALKDLSSALEKTAATEEIAKVAIDAFVCDARSDTPCPKPGDIKATVARLAETMDTAKIAREKRTKACQQCGGTGFRSEQRGEYSFGRVCDCRKQPASVVRIA